MGHEQTCTAMHVPPPSPPPRACCAVADELHRQLAMNATKPKSTKAMNTAAKTDRVSHLFSFLRPGFFCQLTHVLHGQRLQVPSRRVCFPLLQLLLCLYRADAAPAQVTAGVKVCCDLAVTALATQQGAKATLATSKAQVCVERRAIGQRSTTRAQRAAAHHKHQLGCWNTQVLLRDMHSGHGEHMLQRAVHPS